MGAALNSPRPQGRTCRTYDVRTEVTVHSAAPFRSRRPAGWPRSRNTGLSAPPSPAATRHARGSYLPSQTRNYASCPGSDTNPLGRAVSRDRACRRSHVEAGPTGGSALVRWEGPGRCRRRLSLSGGRHHRLESAGCHSRMRHRGTAGICVQVGQTPSINRGVTSCSRCCSTLIRPSWTPCSRSCGWPVPTTRSTSPAVAAPTTSAGRGVLIDDEAGLAFTGAPSPAAARRLSDPAGAAADTPDLVGVGDNHRVGPVTAAHGRPHRRRRPGTQPVPRWYPGLSRCRRSIRDAIRAEDLGR